jgi:hypothetical protein
MYRPSGVVMGFPRERRVKLVYVDHFNVTGASGTLENRQFRLNSLFDPDYTATGHQPLAFDQWAAFYNHYCVHSARFEVQANNSGSSGTLTGIYVSDDQAVPTSLLSMMELGAEVQMSNTYSGSLPSVHKGVLDVAKFFNRDKRAITTDYSLRAAVTANPTEIVFLNVCAQNFSLASHATQFLVRIEFDATFMEPKDLPAS